MLDGVVEQGSKLSSNWGLPEICDSINPSWPPAAELRPRQPWRSVIYAPRNLTHHHAIIAQLCTAWSTKKSRSPIRNCFPTCNKRQLPYLNETREYGSGQCAQIENLGQPMAPPKGHDYLETTSFVLISPSLEEALMSLLAATTHQYLHHSKQ